MADIFDEINEELRAERMSGLWKRYGRYVIALAVLIVLAVGGRQAWQGWQQSRAEAAANAFYTALQSGDPAAELASLEVPQGYQMLARFRRAALLLADGQQAEAEEIYLALSEEENLERIYREAALLLSVGAAKTTGAAELIDRLTPLSQSPSPLQGLALEAMAGLHLKAGDRQAAEAALQSIADIETVSPALRRRAAEMAEILQPGQGKTE